VENVFSVERQFNFSLYFLINFIKKTISKTLKIDVFGSVGAYKKIIGIAEIQKECSNQDDKKFMIYDIQ